MIKSGTVLGKVNNNSSFKPGTVLGPVGEAVTKLEEGYKQASHSGGSNKTTELKPSEMSREHHKFFEIIYL